MRVAPTAHVIGGLPAGTTLNRRYTITNTLRDDGGTALYLGRTAHVRAKPVMIKEVVPDRLVSPEHRAHAERRFARELRVLQSITHPALPGVLDAFSAAGRHYLVMTYCAGETLETMLERRGCPFAEGDVVGWALDILSALTPLHCHTPPVIHRNLKPASLIVDPAGMLRLLDFGLARFCSAGKNQDTAPIGAVGYAPPEQTDGSTDPRADLYALGATLHHLLTNQHPALCPPGPLSPSTCNPAVSSGLAAIIARATDRDPARRWSSASEMERALRRHALALGGTRPLVAKLPPRRLQDAASPPRARLVVSAARLSLGADQALQHLSRLTWLTPAELEMALARVPAVLPLVEPYKSSLQALKGFGVEARPIWPLRGWHVLSAQEALTLEAEGRVAIDDAAACDDGLCLCRHCHFGWLLDDGAAPLPDRCPSCGRERWNTVMLLRCRWCGHEYEDRDTSGTCACCGLPSATA
jgi:tRNA A-37 threonylcarbamoyl transferase component Bud32